MLPADTDRLGDELHAALRGRHTVAPLTERVPGITIDDAYGVSRRLLSRRLADGERVVGKKIGVTSEAVQSMLDVRQPDFGFLTDAMLYESGAAVPVAATLIQPRAEGEIAFVLARDLAGPGITEADVLAATKHVRACFEIVDSRIRDWKIRIEDTVADNASSGVFVLGRDEVSPRGVDLAACCVRVEKNGAPLSEGVGAAALGSPAYCVAWLANTLSRFGIPLKAGEVILSGSLVPLEPVRAGDRMTLVVEGIGEASVSFV
ncbi:MAG TPA: fumarylacetoacetate hydrolase family protein [Polyangiaceae bacterium]|nr:fumarylacetoacetate hydrolase family protein [Polyangiaceae bacterium]